MNTPHIILILTDKCNLHCKYCYERNNINYKKCSFMKPEVAFKSVVWGMKEILKTNVRKIKFVFFGGEPLLNFDVLKGTIVFIRALSEQLGIKPEYLVVTNGLLIDREILSFADKYNIYFQLSLDGEKSSNDIYRTDHRGKGSFEQLCQGRGLSVIKPYIERFGVNLIYTPKTIDNFFKNICFLLEQGFKKIQCRPVMGRDWEWQRKNYLVLEKEFIKLGEFISATKYVFTNSIVEPLSSMLQKLKSNCKVYGDIYCYAGKNMVAITPQGHIFPCHRFAFMDFKKKVDMGNIFNNNIDNPPFKLMKNKYNYINDSCAKCEVNALCENQCMAMNLLINQDLFMPQNILCEITKIIGKISKHIYLNYLKGRHETSKAY